MGVVRRKHQSIARNAAPRANPKASGERDEKRTEMITERRQASSMRSDERRRAPTDVTSSSSEIDV